MDWTGPNVNSSTWLMPVSMSMSVPVPTLVLVYVTAEIFSAERQAVCEKLFSIYAYI